MASQVLYKYYVDLSSSKDEFKGVTPNAMVAIATDELQSYDYTAYAAIGHTMQWGSEKTLIVETFAELPQETINQLKERMGQEAILLVREYVEGVMI